MDIFVNLLFINMENEIYKINVKENTTLADAKELIREQSCVYPEEQIWFINNNPAKQLDNFDWSKSSNYSIIVNTKWFDFKIKTITGNIIDVKYLSSRDKISIIKYHIYQKIKLNPSSYKLLARISSKMTPLHDDEMIGKYFIPNNSTIELIINLNSGFY